METTLCCLREAVCGDNAVLSEGGCVETMLCCLREAVYGDYAVFL